MRRAAVLPLPRPLTLCLGLLVPLALLGLPMEAARGQTLKVHVLPQIPFGPDGVPDLPMARSTAAWAAKAGLSLNWAAVPLQRSLLELQSNREPFCALGLFSTAERRRFARFSQPVHLGEQQVFLATTPAAAKLRQHPSAEAALRDPELRLLAFRDVTYGELLDGWIAQRAQPPHWATAGSVPILDMLQRGRADFTISVATEVKALQAQVKPGTVGLEAVLLPGMPPPPARHLACSQLVPPDWLDRFDAAVRADPPR